MSLRHARLLLMTALWSGHILLLAQQNPGASPGSASPSSHADVNLLTQSALQQGVLNCVGRINQVGNFLGFGAQAAALYMGPGDRPDQRLLSFSMEIPVEGPTAYVAATFAPNQANGCGAVYEAVIYRPQSCEALAASDFASFKRLGLLRSAITVLDGGAATKVFLMPAGSGCLSIKKEIVL